MRSLKLACPIGLALAGSLVLLQPAPAAPPERDPAKPAPAASAGEPFAESIDVRVVNVEVFVSDRSGGRSPA